MEGGVAILLLVIVIVVGGAIGLALYLTGGALSLRKPEADTEHRPTHKRVTSPELEHTNFGSRSED